MANKNGDDFDPTDYSAAHGLLDRRLFLRGGALFGTVMGYGVAGESQAENLFVQPWMQHPDPFPKPYDAPSCFEHEVIKRGEPSSSKIPELGTVRTPIHQLTGTMTPNGLHYVRVHTGVPDIDPAQHRLLIHGMVKRPLIFDLETLARYPIESRNLFLISAAAGMMSVAMASEAPHLGRPASTQDIQAYEIEAMPDGRFLPQGHGTAKEGEAIFVEKCQSCHGEKGVKGIALALQGGEATIGKQDVKPLRTVGSYWPYAPSIFSYIRRAMPYYDSKSLSVDEIYALTAYLLALNKLIGENDEMNATTLEQFKMPWRDRFRPFKRGD